MANPVYHVYRVVWPCEREAIELALNQIVAQGGTIDHVLSRNAVAPTPDGTYCNVDIVWHK